MLSKSFSNNAGAKDQIAGKLKDRGFGKKECSPAGAYAAKVGYSIF